ncbi:hypothetical protein [Streptomyces sp. NPDC058426]|uniref:hypothetical protein n=1 Tax=Streptomyces sp. NPDC058426 TaxID=3346493 RepID=UPI0036472666
MCISAAPAAFTGTTLYCGRVRHERHGLVHVLGYQNTAENHADGPNAMILHLPARELTPGHFLRTAGDDGILRRMVDAVRPRRAAAGGMDWMDFEAPRSVQVFEHDVYTVLLAADPTDVPAALHRVPARRRPALDPGLLAFYAEHFPAHTFAICCFDNAEARTAKPLLLWYEPLDPDVLTVPALDSHTGGAPDLAAHVPTDHWVLFSTDEAPEGWGAPVAHPPATRHALRAFLPTSVAGRSYAEPLPNGDFRVTHAALLADETLERVRRVAPGRP